jgi:hypothetical protein
VLDPGDFGPVTINKSVTIDAGGMLAGILVSTTGVTISAGPSDTVILRGLHIDGAGTGQTGVSFQSGGSLYVEKCTISNLTTYGISFETGLASQLFVSDTTIENNANPVSSPVPAGIMLSAFGTAKSTATIDGTRIQGFTNGLLAKSLIKASVSRSVISGNSKHGISVQGSSLVSTENCVLANNAGSGIIVNAVGAIVLINNDTIVNNGAGLSYGSSSGSIISTKTNMVSQNSGKNGNASSTVALR